VIHIITGKPRGGKSLYAVRLVVEELRHGRRPVVTNLPLLLDRLVAYLPEVDVVRRVRILSDAELGEFYFRRGWDEERRAWVNGGLSAQSGTLQPDMPVDGGVFFVLDEAHLVFSQWDKVGRPAIWYLSQHGHYGDDIVLVTQHADMLNKALRVLAQDFTVLANLAKVRAFGFRGPARFLRRTFQSWPCRPGAECETGSFRLDVTGLASLYNTADGVGIHDRAGADTKARVRGLPWWTLAAGLLVGFGLFLLVVRFGSGALVRAVLGPMAGMGATVTPAPGAAPVSSPAVVAPPAPAPAPVPPPAPELVAVALAAGRVMDADGVWWQVLGVSAARDRGTLVGGRAWRLATVAEAQRLQRERGRQ